MYPMYPYYGYETKCENKPVTFPPQHQERQPGLEYLMDPVPISDNPQYVGSGKLQDKVAIITGGDSGIGRAVAIGFAKEGADVVIPYLYEHEDAKTTMEMVSRYGRRCLPIMGDLRDETFSYEVVRKTLESFGKIDVLVLNQGVQFPQESILNISTQQLEDTFRTNIFPHFFMTKAALPYLRPGSSIISTASVTAYAGAPLLVDYIDQRCGRFIYPFFIAPTGEKRDKGERGSSWSNLDPAHRFQLLRRIRKNVRHGVSHAAGRSAVRAGPDLHLLGVGRFLLRYRTGAARQRRHYDRDLNTVIN